VRVFQRFATLDLISNGRAEIVVGRGSFIEAFPLFGLNPNDYDELFADKLALLLELRENNHIHWVSKHRAPLSGQGVYPRPVQQPLPVWLGVGGTPQSFARAGSLGLPLMVAIIGGDFRRFRPHVNLYREAGRQAGFTPEQLKVGVHAFGYVASSSAEARDIFYPGFAYMISTLGKERGWPPASRQEFDAACGPMGPYLIGDAKTVADKILYVDEVLGGIERISLQMTNVMVTHEQMIASIGLLGHEVAPIVRQQKVTG
jgi:alkanesulfonate monooxygenase SsuD/methylene tetrahydromethanopterin reductase-like flavin-dependent oxidoreductase (luciferase family)